MQIKYVGFKLLSGVKNFSSSDFYNYLASISGAEVENAVADRFFFFDNTSRSGYLVGLIVTLKDQKRVCRAELVSGDFTFKTDELGEDKLIDFNFFAVRHDTGKGVVQYYHNSCSPNVFGDFCKRSLYDKKKMLVLEKCKELSGDASGTYSEKIYKKASRFYAGRPRFSILIDPRNIEAIISAFREIKALNVTFEAPKAPTDAAVAAKKLSDTVSLRYKFAVSQQVGDISQAVRQLIDRDGFLRGRASGIDEHDEERSIDLLKAPHNFGHDDFDVVAEEVNNLKASEFTANKILDDLVDILEDPNNELVFATVDKG